MSIEEGGRFNVAYTLNEYYIYSIGLVELYVLRPTSTIGGGGGTRIRGGNIVYIYNVT